MFVAVFFLTVSVLGALLIKKEATRGRAQVRTARSTNIELTEALILEGSSEDEENNYDGA